MPEIRSGVPGRSSDEHSRRVHSQTGLERLRYLQW